MSSNQLLVSQTSSVGTGAAISLQSGENVRTLQFNPAAGTGFTGEVIVQGSFALSPGANDWVNLVTIDFSKHTYSLSLDVASNVPVVRGNVSVATGGAISVYVSGRTGTISGNTGVNSTIATAIINSSLTIGGTGTNFHVNAAIVPSFTSDDVVYANDLSKTVTDMLAGTNGAPGFQTKIGDGNVITTSADLNVLAGLANYGLTNADMQRVANTNASTTEINNLVGTTSNIQTQLNSFSALMRLNSVTASAADINTLTGTAGTFTSANLAMLGQITASAADINRLTGFTGNSTILNRLTGLTSSTADLNAINGLAASGVNVTQLGYLSGLTTNVQSALATIPNLLGLTSSVNDINILAGASTGSGSYVTQITATEVSYLANLTANIQAQLDGKRPSSGTIGVNEISGSSITTVELNYLQGATLNIQTQLNNLTMTKIGSSGGLINGALQLASGTSAAPAIGFQGAYTGTGIYKLPVGAGLGIAVGGTGFAAFDGTNLILGDGVTTGGPRIQAVGFSATVPTYSFTGDTDTGISYHGTNAISIVAGAKEMATFDYTNKAITIGGAVADNNVVSVVGKFAGEKLLGSVAINGKVGGVTASSYNVPAGRNAIITKVVLLLTSATGVAPSTNGGLAINLGWSPAPSYNQLIDSTLTATQAKINPSYGFNTTGQTLIINDIGITAGANYQFVPAGANVAVNVVTAATATTYNFTVYIFGFEY